MNNQLNCFLTATIVGFSLCSCGNDQKREIAAEFPWPDTFALPSTVVVSTGPYPSVAAALEDSINIDWYGDPMRQRAATLAYAASEIKNHFSLIDVATDFVEPVGEPGSGNILLVVNGDPESQELIDETNVDYGNLGEQGFEIGVTGKNIYVTANTPVGVLHGVYRLLEYLGFAWYSPDEISVPEIQSNAVRWEKIRQVPRVDLRGFWIFGEQMVADEYSIWLGRNRFNVAARIAPRLRHMLGIKEWGGGHELLQQEFSAPGLFELHPDWFSIIDGTRRPVAAIGPYFNPAFGNSDAANFFADRMIERLSDGDLSEIDILNIWPADSRGQTFDQSPMATNLGNETDNLLSFYGIVAERFRQAYADGLLNRLVTVGGISYYRTWQPPTNTSVVDSLESSNYFHIFYLNERSWAGAIREDLETRDINRGIVENLAEWQIMANLDYGFVEYYNYSIYAALALTDINHIQENYQYLTNNQRALFGYMHPLKVNPGPRRLTNELLAKLGWTDILTNGGNRRRYIAEVTDAYFDRRYGENASQWKEIYTAMSTSVENAAEIFGHRSLYWLLLQNQIWADPPYSDAEVVTFIPMYRMGGSQYLPDFSSGNLIQSKFYGLDDSIRLQENAALLWQALLEATAAPGVREAMQSDIDWFESTRSRYRLMAASSDFVTAKAGGDDLENARIRMRQEIDFLETSNTTDDTLSPVDQRLFLSLHRRLAGIDAEIDGTAIGARR